jgi:hypothetical protein
MAADPAITLMNSRRLIASPGPSTAHLSCSNYTR